ncbi:MAG: hypothetical protein ACPG49_04165, partial [Chitinophagales bacterium]
TFNTPNDNRDNTPQTRVVPVATVEDIHGANHAYQPYENHNPVVQPSSVKTESMKQRRERHSTSTTYENRTSSPNRNDNYTIEANPKPKKRSFKEFIQETFSSNESSDMPDYESDSNSNKEKIYRSNRSSSSSSNEYKNSRPVRTKTYNNTEKESKQNSSNGEKSNRNL